MDGILFVSLNAGTTTVRSTVAASFTVEGRGSGDVLEEDRYASSEGATGIGGGDKTTRSTYT
jgi:hypothetical protein